MNKQIEWENDPQLMPPALLQPWLMHEGSLTDKLTALPAEASVSVISSQWVHAGWWERYVLQLDNVSCFQREILMTSQQIPCWYARTLATETVYHQHRDFFDRLQTTTLNTLLFREQKAIRQNMLCYSVTRDHFEFFWVEKALAAFYHEANFQLPAKVRLWGRRSCFLIEGQSPFYLIEFYCPTFMELLQS